MQREAHFKRYLPIVVIFLTGFFATVLLTTLVIQVKISQDRKLALHTAEVYTARTERLLDGLFHKTDVLSAILVNNHGELEEGTFENLARTLAGGAGIRSIQCLPGGTVQYCYPREGNKEVIGKNVFDNPKRRDDAMLAVRTRSIALSGPYALTQGGFGLVARNPVFLNSAGKDDTFYGFTVIILDLPEALQPLLLEELTEEGYAYSLHCIIDTGEEKTITQAGSPNWNDCIDYEIHVPNHTWTLSISPEGGWIPWSMAAFLLLTGVLVSALITVVIYQWQERARALHRASLTDDLTGLYNRRFLNDIMDKRCKKGTPEFDLYYMDLDRFKQTNDSLEHRWGDTLLMEAAKRIADILGPDALLSRIGGDEFTAVMEGTSRGPEMIEKIHETFEKPFILNEVPVCTGISVGCSHFPDDGSDYDTLLHNADQRMYEDKQKRHQIRIEIPAHSVNDFSNQIKPSGKEPI